MQQIEDKKVIFLRPNGTIATNVIVHDINETDGELMFMEILELSSVVKGGLRINGKETYKRIFVQRVYPCIESNE